MSISLPSFQMPGSVIAGVGAAESIGEEVKRLGARRVLIITDRGIAATGLVDKIESCIRSVGVETGVFAEVMPEPTEEVLDPCLSQVHKLRAEVLVGLGGGSSIDVTKGVSILATNGGSIADYVGVEKVPARGMQAIMLPTTAGTGAEMTPNAIFTNTSSKVKRGVVSRYLIPDVAIVDPLLTVTVPPSVTAATGIDALTHAIESYTSLRASAHTDLYALEAIGLISRSIRDAVNNGRDLRARTDMALGSMYAGVSLANAGVGAVHALAYPLGGRFAVSHGVANALLLPYVMEYNATGNITKFARIASELGENVDGLSLREAAFRGVKAVRELTLDVGIPQRLSDVGVISEALSDMATAAASNARLMSNNPRPVGVMEAEKIYRDAF